MYLDLKERNENNEVINFCFMYVKARENMQYITILLQFRWKVTVISMSSEMARKKLSSVSSAGTTTTDILCAILSHDFWFYVIFSLYIRKRKKYLPLSLDMNTRFYYSFRRSIYQQSISVRLVNKINSNKDEQNTFTRIEHIVL